MSKVSTPTFPQYAGGTVSINDEEKATSKLSAGKLLSNYQMNDYEKAIYDYSQKTLAELLPQLNNFSASTLSDLQSQLNAYKSNGTNAINQIYNPMINNLKNDIASRFGNLDNSMFMNNLNNIEGKRADAVSSFAQDVMARQSELLNEEMARRYTLADFLGTMQSLPLQNATSLLNLALNGSNSINSYNTNLYNSLYKQYLQNMQSTSGLGNNALSLLGALSGGTSSFLL